MECIALILILKLIYGPKSVVLFKVFIPQIFVELQPLQCPSKWQWTKCFALFSLPAKLIVEVATRVKYPLPILLSEYYHLGWPLDCRYKCPNSASLVMALRDKTCDKYELNSPRWRTTEQMKFDRSMMRRIFNFEGCTLMRKSLEAPLSKSKKLAAFC